MFSGFGLQMSHQSKFPFIYQPIPDKSSLPIISESFQISRDLPDILWEQTDVEDFVEGEKFIVKPKVKAPKRPKPARDANGKKIRVKKYKMCEHCGLKLVHIFFHFISQNIIVLRLFAVICAQSFYRSNPTR